MALRAQGWHGRTNLSARLASFLSIAIRAEKRAGILPGWRGILKISWRWQRPWPGLV